MPFAKWAMAVMRLSAAILPNFRDYLDVMTVRLARLNPRRAEVYAQWLKEFDQEADFLRDVELNDISGTRGAA